MLLQKVVQVRSIVEEELGFVASVEDEKKRPCTAFLCIIQKRVVGLALIEAIETAYVLQSSSSPLRSSNLQERSPVGMDGISNSRPNEARKVEVETTDRRGDDHWERSIEARPAILGIYQLWVHQQHRKCGIATALLDTVRAHAVFGCHNLPLNRLAFSSPTEAGIRFALQYCSEHSHRPKTHSTTPICVAEAEVLVYDCC